MIEKNILLTLTYLVGAGELILAIYFWVTNSKNEIRRVMSLLLASTGLWVVSSAFLSYKPQTPVTVFASGLVFVAAIFMLSTLVHLVSVFPYRTHQFDRLHVVLFYIPALIFSISSFVPNLMMRGLSGGPDTVGVIYPGPLYNIYNSYGLVLYLLVVIILFSRLKKLDGQHRQNTKLLLWAVFLGGFPGVILDLVLPLVAPTTQPNFLFGNLASVAWLGIITYIIQKK